MGLRTHGLDGARDLDRERRLQHRGRAQAAFGDELRPRIALIADDGAGLERSGLHDHFRLNRRDGSSSRVWGRQVDLMGHETSRAIEHRGARIAGGLEPIEALAYCGRRSRRSPDRKRSPRGRAQSARRSCRFRRSGMSAWMLFTSPFRCTSWRLDGRQRHAPMIHHDVATHRRRPCLGPGRPISCASAGNSVAVIEKGAIGGQGKRRNSRQRPDRRTPLMSFRSRSRESSNGAHRRADRRTLLNSLPGAILFRARSKGAARLNATSGRETAGGLGIQLLGANEVRAAVPTLDRCVGRDLVQARRTANRRLATPAVARADAHRAPSLSEHTRRLRSKGWVIVFEPPGSRSRSRLRMSSRSGAWGNQIAEQFGETLRCLSRPANFVTSPCPIPSPRRGKMLAAESTIRQVERGNVIVGFTRAGPRRVRIRAPVAPEKPCKPSGMLCGSRRCPRRTGDTGSNT